MAGQRAITIATVMDVPSLKAYMRPAEAPVNRSSMPGPWDRVLSTAKVAGAVGVIGVQDHELGFPDMGLVSEGLNDAAAKAGTDGAVLEVDGARLTQPGGAEQKVVSDFFSSVASHFLVCHETGITPVMHIANYPWWTRHRFDHPAIARLVHAAARSYHDSPPNERLITIVSGPGQHHNLAPDPKSVLDIKYGLDHTGAVDVGLMPRTAPLAQASGWAGDGHAIKRPPNGLMRRLDDPRKPS